MLAAGAAGETFTGAVENNFCRSAVCCSASVRTLTRVRTDISRPPSVRSGARRIVDLILLEQDVQRVVSARSWP